MLREDSQTLTVSRKSVNPPTSPCPPRLSRPRPVVELRFDLYVTQILTAADKKTLLNVSFTSSVGCEKGEKKPTSDIYPAMNHKLPRMMC